MKGNATISFMEELPPSPIKYNFHIHLSAKIGLDDRGLTKDILHYFLFFYYIILRLWKNSSCFGLDRKRTQQTL